ncbi:MAG: tetratricopeptide repeat protein, partial [Planctomycetota bacterium]
VAMLFVLGCSSYDPHKESFANVVKKGNIPVKERDTYRNDAVLQRALGEKYYKDQQYHLAAEQFTSVVEMTPGDVRAYDGLGRSYREMGEYGEAIEALNRGILLRPPSSTSPEFAIPYATKGVTYDMMGKHEKAVVVYETAITLDPTNDVYYNNMGFSYLLKAQELASSGKHEEESKAYKKAISIFKKALEIDQNNKSAHANLGYAYGATGMYQLAQKQFAAATDEAVAYNNMGYLYAQNGKLTKAIESYNNALKVNPNIASIYYNKGTAYQMLGDVDNAILAYQEFIDKTTNISSAEEAFKRLQKLKSKTYVPQGQKVQELSGTN